MIGASGDATGPWGDGGATLSGAQTRMGPLSCRFTGCVLGMVMPLPPRLGGHPGALKARLPHAVPLHPAARTPGTRRRRQGPGTPGAAPPAQHPAPPSPTPKARARRPCPAGCNQPRAAPIALVLLACQAGDAAALAPSLGRRRVDVSSRTRATAAGGGRAGADRASGQGEPTLGLPAHPRRAASAGHAGLGHRDPHHAAPPPDRSSTTADSHVVAGLPAPAGRRDGRLRPASPSTPSGCGGCRCCSSSSWTAAASTWLA
jgi:hypothetical protein